MKFLKKISHLVMSSMTLCLIIITSNLFGTYNMYNFSLVSFSVSHPNPVLWTDTLDFTLLNDFKTTTVTTQALQILNGDSNDLDTTMDFYREKPLSFSQKIKSCYLGAQTTDIDKNLILTNVSQITTPDTSDNTGSYDGHDFNYDIDRRVQNWIDTYNQNLIVNFDQPSLVWQKTNPEFYLNTQTIWPANSSYKNINCPVQFEKNGVKDYVLKDGSEIVWNVGFDRNLYTNSKAVVAAPMCKIKEVLHFYLFYNFVDRFVWTLSGSQNVVGKSLLPYTTDTLTTNCYRFDLNYLISFEKTDINSQGGFITLGINQSFIHTAYMINENQRLIEQLSASETKNKAVLIDLLADLKVSHDNYEVFYDLIVNQNMTDEKQLHNFLQMYPSELTQLANVYGLDIDCQTFKILEDLLDKLTFVINYSTPNVTNPKVYDNYIKKYTYTEMLAFPVIQLNKNVQGNYEIIINDLYNEPLNTSNLYVESVHNNQLYNHSPNFTQTSEATYIINSPTCKSVDFINIDNPAYKSFYPTQKTDPEILKLFTVIYDEYGNVIPIELIKPSEYEIIKDDRLGTVTINLIFASERYWQSIPGFKQMPNFNSESIDAKAIANDRLIASDTNDLILKEILFANGYDDYIVNSLNFTANTINNEAGWVTFNVIDNPLKDEQQQILTVENFSKFYFQQNPQVDQLFLQMKPSQISPTVFLANFVVFTSEFYNRCFNNLKIELFPDDYNLGLNAKITITNYPQIGFYQATYHYDFLEIVIDEQPQNDYRVLLITIGTIGGIILVGIIGWFSYKKFKK